MLAVVRHGDRTPKQKMKMKITQVCIPRTHDMLLRHLSHLKAATKEIDQRTQGCQLVEACVSVQAPMLDLLHRHIDGKGKQAKLKSPNELQVML